MQLTAAQSMTLRNAITADPVLGTLPQGNQSAFDIALNLSSLVSPAYWVLKTSLGKHELTDQPGVDTDGVTATGFVWGGTQGGFINRSPGEQKAWSELFNSTLSCKPHLANVRTAFEDIFSGSGAGAVACRKHIKAMSRRPCNMAEKILAIATVGGPVQTGNRGTATNPDTLTAEGSLDYHEVNSIMGWAE